MKFVVLLAISAVALLGLVSDAGANPSPHHHDDDEYRPLIRALKQLRRRERYEQYAREYETSSRPNEDSGTSATDSSSSNTQFLGQRPQSSSSNSNSNYFSNPEQIQKIIREAQQSNPSTGSGSSGTGSLPPQRIEQINRGVSTILNGVGGGSLEQILRGSFMFTRNNNVRSVANNVLDSIFGFGRQPSNNGN